MYVASATVFEAVYESAITGLVGTVEVAIVDNQNNVVFGPTTVGIVEAIVGGNPTGIYEVDLTAPVDPGQYTIVWSFDGTYDPKTVTVEDLTVVAVTGPLPPIGVVTGGPNFGPCSLWANVDRIAECCDVPTVDDPFPLIGSLADAATAASQFLWSASGRRFSGVCTRTVRPCGQPCQCGYQVLSRGHLIGWNNECWGTPCGCTALSQVSLSGYPVRSITEVTIDGAVLDPSEYRLDEWRYLTRLNGARWPSCQVLDLPSTEEGTFSVTYVHGQDPPELAQQAAIQLGCETWKQCGGLECALPKNATRVNRQGIQFELRYFQRDRNGAWRTGLLAVDEFLNSVNPNGLIRQPTIWSPNSRERFARPV